MTGKTIVILSQQDWGEMFISKHHYALELAKAGNQVYFINGPHIHGLKKGEVVVSAASHENLFIVNHRISFPLFVKYKLSAVYNWLIKRHIANILKEVKNKVDYVWSFDLSDTLPLRCFPNDIKKIFIPVDELSADSAAKASIGASAIFSVTNEILAKFQHFAVPKIFLNHGVAPYFINNDITEANHEPINISLSGNFLRPDIDWQTLLRIIDENDKAIFHFYGSVNVGNANLGIAHADAAIANINKLKQKKNVVLHGQVSPQTLATELKKADCFLICYDVLKDQSGGTNYHKVLEYLAVGKVIVSNNITTYAGSGLIEMPDTKLNDSLPQLFNSVVNDIAVYNTKALQEKRIAFARQHLYAAQIKKIAAYLQ
ncbi:hypothetical protein CAP35_02525 [Chitinophagaceae bacterium IBVUCB1]|nr:hypothetical protein CAP35_02525 [Chitinophagaceae bacterium IBVUCB1]